MLKITRAANAFQPRSAHNSRPHHKARRKPAVVPNHCREPGKQPNWDQTKELGTTQMVSVKAPFGHADRTRRQTPEDASAAVVMKSQVEEIPPASAQPDAQIFLDESLSPITSMDLKEIRRLETFIPVIVLVPRSTVTEQVSLRNTSPAKLSSERSETKELLGVAEKAVKHLKSTSGGNTVAFGDVSVNFSAMEALRNGEPVVFTAMEFKTLKYLIQNAGRVISREELLNEVWGYENYPCTRTVDNHILRLRQKLERDPSSPLHFRTMHRAGYKFLP
jgi:DNA-binding response OmpR family regulator